MLIGIIVFLVSDFLLKDMGRSLAASETELLAFITASLTPFLVLWGSTQLCIHFGLYRRRRLNTFLIVALIGSSRVVCSRSLRSCSRSATG